MQEIECSLLRPPKITATRAVDMGARYRAHHSGLGMTQRPEHSALDLSTLAVTKGRPPREPDAPLNTPIVPASSFIAGGPTEYAREGGPTVFAFEEVIAALECTERTRPAQAVAFSSGMAAADAVLDLIPVGGRVVAPTTTYTGVAVRLRELAEWGRIDLTLIDVTDTDAIVDTLTTGVHTLWLESPTNPLLEEADLATCLPAARSAGVRTVVDNTFATPILQRPLELGAHVVMHSATKSLSGHSDLLMGALVTEDPELAEELRTRRIRLGAAPSAFDAYLALRGVRTLALRIQRAEASAQFVAKKLRSEPSISRVRQAGTMVSIEFGGDAARADRVCQGTRLWAHATSLGGVESLLERRRRWPLEAEHVPEDLVRLSVGIEDPSDLWADLAHAIHAG